MIHTSSAPDCVIVVLREETAQGEASANCVGPVWWINRVIIQPSRMRGQGRGSNLLQMLIKEVQKQGYKLLMVTPGGYDNNRQQQFNFYRKNGFVHPSPDEVDAIARKHTLVYRA